MSRPSYDEDDVRVRPGPGSRPRTRRRPRHEDAAEALVTAVDRGRYACRLDERTVVAMKARELGRRSVVVGDQVALVGDLSAAPGTLARIVRISPRANVLRRTADDVDPVERVIVANVDQLVIVVSVDRPPPRTGLIDRCLVAAYDAAIDPLLCITKTDLAAPDELLSTYAALKVPAVVSARGSGVAELERRLADLVSVLVGHSGVGKSTLVNALVPAALRVTGEVNAVTGRGRHVSSSVVGLPLPGGGWVIDTPGVRSFGLAHVRSEDVVAAFPDLAPGASLCPRGCAHLDDSCVLDEWVAGGHASRARLDSLRRLLAARTASAEAS